MGFYVIVVLAVLFFVCWCVKERLATYEAESKLLQEKWKTAREFRLFWKDKHPFDFNFNDPEYQTLWEVEIGAEDLYLLHISNICHGACISWTDYKLEEKEFKFKGW